MPGPKNTQSRKPPHASKQHDGDNLLRPDPDRSQPGESSRDAPLPHELDEGANLRQDAQHDAEPRAVGKQAHEDLENGLVDTDRRGGAQYQEQSQSDEHVNENSRGVKAQSAQSARPTRSRDTARDPSVPGKRNG